MSIRWWEKTVEYEFVMLVSREKRLFLAPLDGEHERAGDAVFSSNNRWVLIEFKKNAATIRTEKEKFVRYAEAKATLSPRDDHHHIIFGQESAKNPSRLELRAQTYFSETSRDLNGILSSGQSFSEFKAYVDQYIKLKKGPQGGGGTGMTMEDLALVAGVNADNNVIECLSLSEFQRQRGLELQQEQQQERQLPRGFDGPSL
jgi:hypothetical protein